MWEWFTAVVFPVIMGTAGAEGAEDAEDAEDATVAVDPRVFDFGPKVETVTQMVWQGGEGVQRKIVVLPEPKPMPFCPDDPWAPLLLDPRAQGPDRDMLLAHWRHILENDPDHLATAEQAAKSGEGCLNEPLIGPHQGLVGCLEHDERTLHDNGFKGNECQIAVVLQSVRTMLTKLLQAGIKCDTWVPLWQANDHRYWVTYVSYMGSMRSPFQKDPFYIGYEYGAEEITVLRDDGKKLTFNTAQILMALNGFFPTGGKYNMAPMDVVEFFGIKPDGQYPSNVVARPFLSEINAVSYNYAMSDEGREDERLLLLWPEAMCELEAAKWWCLPIPAEQGGKQMMAHLRFHHTIPCFVPSVGKRLCDCDFQERQNLFGEIAFIYVHGDMPRALSRPCGVNHSKEYTAEQEKVFIAEEVARMEKAYQAFLTYGMTWRGLAHINEIIMGGPYRAPLTIGGLSIKPDSLRGYTKENKLRASAQFQFVPNFVTTAISIPGGGVWNEGDPLPIPFAKPTPPGANGEPDQGMDGQEDILGATDEEKWEYWIERIAGYMRGNKAFVHPRQAQARAWTVKVVLASPGRAILVAKITRVVYERGPRKEIDRNWRVQITLSDCWGLSLDAYADGIGHRHSNPVLPHLCPRAIEEECWLLTKESCHWD